MWLDGTASGGSYSVDNTFHLSVSVEQGSSSGHSQHVVRRLQPSTTITDEQLLAAGSRHVVSRRHAGTPAELLASSLRHRGATKQAAHPSSSYTGIPDQPCAPVGPRSGPEPCDSLQGHKAKACSLARHQRRRLRAQGSQKWAWAYMTSFFVLMGGLHACGWFCIVEHSECERYRVRLKRDRNAQLSVLSTAVPHAWMELSVMYATLTLAFALYIRLLYTPPGRLPSLASAAAGPGERLLWLAQVVQYGTVDEHGRKVCSTCETVRPLRSKHMKGSCVARLDHFCVWTGGPVAAGNHRAFLAFVFAEFFHLACASLCLLRFLLTFPEWSLAAAWSARTSGLAWLTCGIAVVLCIFLAFTGALLVEQLGNAAWGMTTNEKMNSDRYHYVPPLRKGVPSLRTACSRWYRLLWSGPWADFDAAAIQRGIEGTHLRDSSTSWPLNTARTVDELWQDADIRECARGLGWQSAAAMKSSLAGLLHGSAMSKCPSGELLNSAPVSKQA